MILTIDYRECSIMGRTYWLGGLSQGFLKHDGDYPAEKRIYFSGETKEQCVEKALLYADTLTGISEKYKFTQTVNALSGNLEFSK